MEKVPSPRKPGTMRCLQTEDIRPGTCDLKAIREKGGAFEAIHEKNKIIGFISCVGCPGKKAVLRGRQLIRRGADTRAPSSCIQNETPVGCPCPLAKRYGRPSAQLYRRGSG